MNLIEGRVVSTPQGYKALTKVEDITDILAENGLDEINAVIIDMADETSSRLSDELSCLEDEFTNYERQNDEYHDCILDNAEAIRELINKVNDSKRLNKSELVKSLTEIYDNLWAEV